MGIEHLVRSILLLVAVLLPGVTAAQSTQRTITQVADHLYWAQNATHRSIFLVTDDGIVLVDPVSAEFARWLRGEIEARFDVPVKYVLYSHHHWDHASGGAVFADTARFVGHSNFAAHLALPPAGTALPADAAATDRNGDGRLSRSEAAGTYAASFDLYDADRDGSISGAEAVRGPLNDVRAPDLTFDDRLTITLGGVDVELIHVGQMAHTDDMSIVLFPDQRAVFVVDFVSLGRLPFRTLVDGQLNAWLNAIRAVELLDVDVVAPGHGVVGNLEDVAAHRHYIEELRDRVAEGMARGASLADLQAEIMMTPYQNWISYRDWRTLNIEGMYRILSE
jgi:glyoxylase-like metal-dependent hydrolase (beta-lactamase superfamily II)